MSVTVLGTALPVKLVAVLGSTKAAPGGSSTSAIACSATMATNIAHQAEIKIILVIMPQDVVFRGLAFKVGGH